MIIIIQENDSHQNMCKAASRRPTLSELTESNRNLRTSGHWLFPSSSRFPQKLIYIIKNMNSSSDFWNLSQKCSNVTNQVAGELCRNVADLLADVWWGLLLDAGQKFRFDGRLQVNCEARVDLFKGGRQQPSQKHCCHLSDLVGGELKKRNDSILSPLRQIFAMTNTSAIEAAFFPDRMEHLSDFFHFKTKNISFKVCYGTKRLEGRLGINTSGPIPKLRSIASSCHGRGERPTGATKLFNARILRNVQMHTHLLCRRWISDSVKQERDLCLTRDGVIGLLGIQNGQRLEADMQGWIFTAWVKLQFRLFFP